MKLIDVRELAEKFQPLVNLYQPDSGGSALLGKSIQADWNTFSLPGDGAQELLRGIFSGEAVTAGIFDGAVINKARIGDGSRTLLDTWKNFKSEIVNQNRFFIRSNIDVDLLNEILQNKSHTYSTGKIFYRARISTNKGFSASDMGKPPSEQSKAGRANPKGIPYLYLATDEKTTVYEVRASYLDFVTLAEFKLKEDIKVIRLRQTKGVSPFEIPDPMKYVLYEKFLQELEKELSKPIRRYDSELDYLPSQYICEFIKSKGYNGVEYASSLNVGGINLAIFDETKLQCTDVRVAEIKEVGITYS
ncbi:MAG TPA: RES family NAD+ phosphorylase [Candidatus Kryptonia bacterium]